jgi:hypothetical protein
MLRSPEGAPFCAEPADPASRLPNAVNQKLRIRYRPTGRPRYPPDAMIEGGMSNRRLGSRRGRRATAVATVAALGLVLLLGFAEARSRTDADAAVDDAVGFIDTLALTREKPNGVSEAGWVRRWRGPVAVTVEGVAVPGFSAIVARSLARLSQWTGLPFRLTDSAPAGDRIVIRVRHQGVVAASFGVSDAVCLTSTFGDDGTLHRAVVDISERYLDCLDHELMHAIGFNNHWNGGGARRHVASVLAPRRSPDRRSAFSAWDILAIKTLYNAEVLPGTERAEALTRVRAILLEQTVIPAAGE